MSFVRSARTCGSSALPLTTPCRQVDWRVYTLCVRLVRLVRCVPAQDVEAITCRDCLRFLANDTVARLTPRSRGLSDFDDVFYEAELVSAPIPGWDAKRGAPPSLCRFPLGLVCTRYRRRMVQLFARTPQGVGLRCMSWGGNYLRPEGGPKCR